MGEYENLETASAQEVLVWALTRFGDRVAIATSFQKEGMVLVDMAASISPSIRVFTLDTGRLPEETYQMIETVRQRYRIPVEIVFPDAAEVESMVGSHGPNLFYQEVAFRMLCCQIRKVRPLERKLASLKAWVTGLRRSQGAARAGTRKVEEGGAVLKLSPLADWTNRQVEDYIRDNEVPVHPLYARGYTSIGCAPCTRAAREGEEERAGRWWWEQEAQKECGIHLSASGKAERRLDVLVNEVLAAKHA